MSRPEELEKLLEQATPAELRRALMDLYFEVTIVVQDRPLDFPIWAHRIQLLIHFFETIEKE